MAPSAIHCSRGLLLTVTRRTSMARAFGIYGERVTRSEDLPAAIDRALANRPALLDVLVTPQAVSSDAKSGLALVPDLQPLVAWNRLEEGWRRGTGEAQGAEGPPAKRRKALDGGTRPCLAGARAWHHGNQAVKVTV